MAIALIGVNDTHSFYGQFSALCIGQSIVDAAKRGSFVEMAASGGVQL